MDAQQEKTVMDGIARISRLFRNMGVSSKEIRLTDKYPVRLRDAFARLAKGEALPNTAGINAEWSLHPELAPVCQAAISISETLKTIYAANIKESGPDNLKRLLDNPASYNPPLPRSASRGFSMSD
jgi:hypothetical protein